MGQVHDATRASEAGPRPTLLLVLSLLPVLASYENVLDVGFVWDDHVLVEQNPLAHSLKDSWRVFANDFFAHSLTLRTAGGYFRPFITLSFAVDWWWGGGGPVAFHLSNLFLHLLVCATVFALARQLGAQVGAAAVASALFGTMPRLTESVTWVSGRTDVWAAAWVLAALLVDSRGPQRWWTDVSVATLLTLGLFSKEVALAGFAVVAATRWRRGTLSLRGGLVLLLGVFTYAVVRLRAIPGAAAAELHPPNIALARLGHALAMAATPWSPTPQRGFVLEPESWAIGLGVVLLLVAAAGLVALWRRGPPKALHFGVGVGATFALVLTAVVVLRGIYPIMSDRYLYLPLALLCALGATIHLRRWLLGPALALLAMDGVVTWRQNALWANELRFWQVVVGQASPRNTGALLSLADALLDADRPDDAALLYEQALESLSGQLATKTRLSFAAAMSRRGQDAAALTLLQRLRTEEPDWRRAWLDVALFNARALDFAGARQAVDELEAIQGSDDASTALRALIDDAAAVLTSPAPEPLARALALSNLGAMAHAQALFERLLTSPEHRELAARWLVLHGDRSRAEEVLRLDPHPDAHRIYRLRWPEYEPNE